MGDDAPISSTVQAWELGLRLREHRERLGFTAAAVGRTTGIGGTNLSAIESGKRRLTAAKLGDLADAYELADDERAELESLRAQTERREWWYDHARLYSDDFLRLLGLEAGADKVCEYAPDIIPGLLQTADYARAVVRAGTPYIRPVDVDPRLATRLARQVRLDADDPLRLDVVLGEAALRQLVGDTGVMRRQLAHLLDVLDRNGGHVRVRVIPFAAGAHPLLGAALKILSFRSNRLGDLIYQETAISGVIIDKRQVILESTASFAETFDRALGDRDSREFIDAVYHEMERF
ncbi:DNA-binding protein [Saccharothrix sp. NRRL B-16348]|jgi:transcriptional regulator with XRE-family HTH domain|uniref:helix-turn-helix domain-containing protein n=1 Tax=Saccharothrix sp. NRRL B-16348 TaxID=1415542 RepID=UPI0006AFBEFD|nr:helix-turn-helix transcriptional regulator [Saccharothrix sp. NRRL B-16348]KOX31088.1 DNA-binding protein [Saccharothrix sp. NRRL B-16348]